MVFVLRYQDGTCYFMGFVWRYKDGTCYVIGFIVEIVRCGGVGWGGLGGAIAKYVQVCTEHIRKR